MKVAVTGGSGFIGSHVVDALLEAGHEVTVLDIVRPHRDDVDDHIYCNISIWEDIRDVLLTLKPNYIFHFAGVSNSYTAMNIPHNTIHYNVDAVLNLLEANRLVKEHWRLIFASTYFIDMEISNLYTTSKIAAELLIKNYADYYNLSYTILRLGTVYGPRSRGEDVVSKFVASTLSGQNLCISGGGQTRKFIYATDVATGCIAALCDRATNEILTLCGDREYSIFDVADVVLDIIGAKVDRISIPGEFTICSVSNERAKRVLGWQPRVSFEEGVKRYVEWVKLNNNI